MLQSTGKRQTIATTTQETSSFHFTAAEQAEAVGDDARGKSAVCLFSRPLPRLSDLPVKSTFSVNDPFLSCSSLQTIAMPWYCAGTFATRIPC